MTPTYHMANYRISPQIGFNFDELVIDNFAGGGGASTGIEAALGRAIDIAINHDQDAIAMHEINHPQTRHYCESVWDVNPREVCAGRPVGLAWFSPDCKHFSKAKGSKPVEKKIRGLAWVVLRWAATVRPRVIALENVEEFVSWGPLVTDENGDCYPCPKNKGRTFKSFVNALRRHGYQVDWKELLACDYGAPTKRNRLFLVARCDGKPIVWPESTHGHPDSPEVRSGRLLPWRTAAECIDWSVPVPSIFGRKKPLADKTMRRIAKGIMKYVVNNPEPFLVPMEETLPGNKTTARGKRRGSVTPFITEFANASSQRNMPADSPLRTQCAQVKGGHFALVAPMLTKYHGESPGVPGNMPFPTITACSYLKRPGGNPPIALVQAFLAKHYGSSIGYGPNEPAHTFTGKAKHSVVTAHLVRQFGQSVGSSPTEPLGAVMPGGLGKTGVVTSHLIKLRGTCKDGQAVTDPLHTISAQGTHFGEVRAFLAKYRGAEEESQLGLVTIGGETYQIVDISLRMLTPRELFRAQGFPENYVIEHDAKGRKFTKTAQVAKCGNSVSPYPAKALIRANMVDRIEHQLAA